MRKLITLLLSATFACNAIHAQNTSGKKTKSGGEIFTYVEQMPEAPFNVNEYLSRQIKYPADAKKLKKSGRVVLKFIINETGDIDSVTVVNSVFPSIDSTAVSVVEKMPKWIPGKSAGTPVKVYFTLPILFSLK